MGIPFFWKSIIFWGPCMLVFGRCTGQRGSLQKQIDYNTIRWQTKPRWWILKVLLERPTASGDVSRFDMLGYWTWIFKTSVVKVKVVVKYIMKNSIRSDSICYMSCKLTQISSAQTKLKCLRINVLRQVLQPSQNNKTSRHSNQLLYQKQKSKPTTVDGPDIPNNHLLDV